MSLGVVVVNVIVGVVMVDIVDTGAAVVICIEDWWGKYIPDGNNHVIIVVGGGEGSGKTEQIFWTALITNYDL